MLLLKEAAVFAGVSYQTVSKIINGKDCLTSETEACVWEAIHELNYRLNLSAKNLRRQRTNKIGVVYNNGVSHINDYSSEIIVGSTAIAQ